MPIKRLIQLSLIPLIIAISSNVIGQETNSILQELSQEQIDAAEDLLNQNNPVIMNEEISSENKPESLIKKCESGDNSCQKLQQKFAPVANKFGYDFINSSPTSIVATGDLPLPNEYKISLGDVIGVVLSGSKERIFDMKVQLDGTVFFPELGSVSVVGESFKEVKDKLRNLIEQSYIGVSLDLSLKDLSAKKITIVGAVNNPGTYLVNPFSTISNSLAYSGGVQGIGSLRNIRLIRSNGEIFIFDLYDLLIKGDRKNDVTIQSGDVIFIGAADKFISIKGSVKRSGTYEILPDESLLDLINYSLGFAGGANTEKITLEKVNYEESSIVNIITSDLSYSLENVLSVNVFSTLKDRSSSIYVDGAIEEPGFYELKNYLSLENLVNDLDFVDVYPWLAVLEQFDEDNLVKSSILFSLNDPNTYRSIKLLPNSKIYFANIDKRDFNVDSSSSRLISEYSLTLKHKQGSFVLPVIGNYSIKSFVDLLGLDMSDVEDEATYISPLDNIIINSNYKDMQFFAKKYHNVSFRAPVNDLISVTIEGAVDYPGTYIMNSDNVVNDLYKLIGDFKPQAFLKGIVFTRESIRDRQLKSIQKSKEDLNRALLISQQKGKPIGDINIINALSTTIEPENLGRISGDFSPGSLSAQKTILLDGDKIIIPRNPNVINVMGEVLNPIAFEYDRRITVRSAIENSGGFKDYASKNKVYVIKSNGLIKKANRNIFVKNIKLEAGDTIVVPRKIIANNPGVDALLPLTQILSDLAFSAAALESLSKN